MAPKHNDQWFAEGLHFTCTQCGNCCSGPPGYVWFTDDEASAIAAYLGITVEVLREKYAEKHENNWSLTDHPTEHGYDCIFLARDAAGRGSCSIYPVRPAQCRTWPFWPDNLLSQTHWRRAGARCPGMQAGMKGEGQLHTLNQIRIVRSQHPE